jgi:hypothetical protein
MKAGSSLTRPQDKLADTIKPLCRSYKSVRRPLLKDRFRDMPFMAKSSLSEMIPRVRLRHGLHRISSVDSYMDRYEKADQFKQDSASEDEIRK